MPFLETSDKKNFEHLCNVEKSHFPFLFIDDCTDKLPKESMLSQFTIVLTTVKVSSLKKSANGCDFYNLIRTLYRDSQESGSMEVLNKNSIMRMRNLVEPLDHIEASIITSSMSTAELYLALF